MKARLKAMEEEVKAKEAQVRLESDILHADACGRKLLCIECQGTAATRWYSLPVVATLQQAAQLFVESSVLTEGCTRCLRCPDAIPTCQAINF